MLNQPTDLNRFDVAGRRGRVSNRSVSSMQTAYAASRRLIVRFSHSVPCGTNAIRCAGYGSAEFLGEPDENAFRASDVAEPVRGLVLDHLTADEMRAVFDQPV